MRALGKTPNDPLIHKMSDIQWKMCILNVIEDEIEQNKKIRDLADLAVKLFVGSPEGGEENKDDFVGGTDGNNPSQQNPVVQYTSGDTNIKKVRSTAFDEIVKSGGKYQGFIVEEDKKDIKNG